MKTPKELMKLSDKEFIEYFDNYAKKNNFDMTAYHNRLKLAIK